MTAGTITFNKCISLFFLPAVIFILSIAFTSCSKEKNKDKEKENLCPVVAANVVPQVVKDSFSFRYPSLVVNTWFRKDSIGYCAYFIQPVNQKKLAQFTAAGVFVKEEIDNDHDENSEDSPDTSNHKITGSCECEIP